MNSTENQRSVASIVDEIERRIIHYYPDLDASQVRIRSHSFEIRRWSFISAIDILSTKDQEKLQTIYIKIPKTNRMEEAIANNVKNKASKKLAIQEYSTLRLLYDNHSNSSTLQVVRPLDYLEECNAILTEEFGGDLLYRICRGETNRLSLQEEHFEDIFFRCGKWLADFQRDQVYDTEVELNQDKFQEELSLYLFPILGKPRLYNSVKGIVDSYVGRYGSELRFSEFMLDGFEIRNILVNEDQKLAVFDLSCLPGFLYNDLARFITSVKIINWGTRKFIYQTPLKSSAYIDAFLRGFYSTMKIVKPVLDLFLLKEWLRQYALAYLSIEGKSYPTMLKKMIQKIYIDPFFQREIKKTVKQMELHDEKGYEELTRSMYRNDEVAEYYKEAYTSLISHRNFRAKVIAMQEKRYIRKVLLRCNLENQMLLDIPCGTGKASDTLPKDILVIASDISFEMMTLARNDYSQMNGFKGFVQADATKIPFKSDSFDCVLNVRLLHRVPSEIKIEIVKEVTRLSKKYVVLSFSVDSFYQRFRKRFRGLFISHDPAMAPITFLEMKNIFDKFGLEIKQAYSVLPLFSNELIALLEKNFKT
jgi:ubiquinone/menaquinone biosynthesis C-methylase UbiE